MKNFKNISREIEKAIINKENDKRFNDKKLFLYSDRKKRTCTEEGTTKWELSVRLTDGNPYGEIWQKVPNPKKNKKWKHEKKTKKQTIESDGKIKVESDVYLVKHASFPL